MARFVDISLVRAKDRGVDPEKGCLRADQAV